jgi:hypothetical protein
MNEKHCFKLPSSQPHPPLPIMNEFSRLLDIKKLVTLPKTFLFIAEEREKETLAQRLGLIAIKKLDVECHAQGTGGQYPIQILAIIRAEVIQSCVLTLKDLPNSIEESVKLALFPSYTDETSLPESFDENQPEAILLNKEGIVDIGEILVQYLSLALDPYPKFEPDQRL